MAAQKTDPKKPDTTTTPALMEEPISQRFKTKIVKALSNLSGHPVTLTAKEERLILGYYIRCDMVLNAAEADRQRKNSWNKDHKYDNTLPYTWSNVNLEELAVDLAHYARVGLDMTVANHLSPIPFKDNKGERYTMTLMEGYNGIRYQAQQYALVPFKNVIVEVVYSNDKFKPIKKDSRRDGGDGYEFEIPMPFDRGDIVGVFGYIEYDDPTNNKLVIFSKRDVEKRKPPKAAAEFWGGTKTVDGRTVEVPGWQDEMFAKTMKREIYGQKNIPHDPDKIDESYLYIQKREQDFIAIMTEAEVGENANQNPIMLPAEDAQVTPADDPAPQPAAAPPVAANNHEHRMTPEAVAIPAESPAAKRPTLNGPPIEDPDDIPDFLKDAPAHK